MQLLLTIGCNDNYQQGNRTEMPVLDLIKFKSLPDNRKIKDIKFGVLGSTYILCDNNRLIVCGSNTWGELGVGSQLIKMLISYWTRPKTISLDIIELIANYLNRNMIMKTGKIIPITCFNHSVQYISSGISACHRFILTNNNELYAFGSNKYLQLSIHAFAKTNQINQFTWFHLKLKSIPKIKEIQCGSTFTMILGDNGLLYALGKSNNGALGLGHIFNTAGKVLCIVNTNIHHKIKSIGCGHNHTIGLTENGDVYSFGYNYFGQLGQNGRSDIYIPSLLECLINDNIKISAISSGNAHNMLLDLNGKVYGFGLNMAYEIGNGHCMNIGIPVMNETLKHLTITDIKCGFSHNVVRTEDKFFLWGSNNYNQCLVFDESDFVKVPTEYNSKYDIVDIFVGYNDTKIVINANT